MPIDHSITVQGVRIPHEVVELALSWMRGNEFTAGEFAAEVGRLISVCAPSKRQNPTIRSRAAERLIHKQKGLGNVELVKRSRKWRWVGA